MSDHVPAMSRRGWSPFQVGLLLLLTAASIWACLPAWQDILSQATRRADAGYILLAVPVAIYLFWMRRSRLRFVRCRPSLWGTLVTLVGLGLTWYGDEVDMHVARHLGALTTFTGAIIAMTGLEVLRQFAAVFLALLFLLPVPGGVRHAIAIPLQNAAATFTHDMLELIGVASEQKGASLVIRGTPIAVGEACDGMRMVFAMGLVVFAFVFSVAFRPMTRLLLLLLSPLIALVCNILRLVPTALVYGFATPETAAHVHDVFGWLMLPAALAMLFGVVRLLTWLDLPVYRWRMLSA